MGIGLGVFLIVIGGILSFTSLDNTLLKTNLDVVGYILMAGGLLALIFGTIQNRQRANTSRLLPHSGRRAASVATRRRRFSRPPVYIHGTLDGRLASSANRAG